MCADWGSETWLSHLQDARTSAQYIPLLSGRWRHCRAEDLLVANLAIRVCQGCFKCRQEGAHCPFSMDEILWGCKGI